MADPENDPGQLVLAYLSLRKAIGILGVALPFTLWLGAQVLFKTGTQCSISRYYYTGMGDVFVGILCAIGVFLLSYKGYQRRDDWAGNLACIFAVGVAVFPTTPAAEPTALQKTIGAVHLTSASLFFLTLAYFSLFLFTKTNPNKTPSRRKRQRNWIYRVCGFAILGSLLLIVIQSMLPQHTQQDIKAYNPVYWLESLAVMAFGVSWLTKGQAILWDET